MDDTITFSSSSPPSRVIPKRHRTVLKQSDEEMCSTTSSSESEDLWTSKRKWTLEKLEMFGLCYDSQSCDISRFCEFATMGNSSFKYPLEEERRKVVESLISQADSVDKPGVTFREGDKSRTWARYRNILQKCDETLQSIDVQLNNPPTKSKLLVLSQAAIRRFYVGLKEFLIESDQILAKEKPIPKQLYTELCSRFLEIFLLNVRSGSFESSGMTIKGVRSSSDPDLRVTVQVPSISLFGGISSVLVVNVEEMKPDYEHRVPAGPFQITEVIQDGILGRHAAQLLLDFKMSVLAENSAIFGIICMRTSLIFTCLKMSWKHYELIKRQGEDVTKKGMAFEEEEKEEESESKRQCNCTEEEENESKRQCKCPEEEESESKRQCKQNEEEESESKRQCQCNEEEENKSKNKCKHIEEEESEYPRKRQCTHREKTSKDPKTKERNEAKTRRSGTIFYTRPYDYLVREDRQQIMGFLFWLGVQVETLGYACN